MMTRVGCNVLSTVYVFCMHYKSYNGNYVQTHNYKSILLYGTAASAHTGWPINIKPHRNLYTKGCVKMGVSQQ